MTTLNTLSRACTSPAALADTLRYLNDGDTLLLIQDAVVMASQSRFASELKRFRLVVLAPDLQARGLSVPEQTEQVDYAGFVQLSLQHQNQVTW
ncbi:sulfurtransferase complex subunit TusB [Ferrimonas marina]|uniref:tRNA 2-thiouridine synthesizing protein B n=1 Tax=Ferrimonas marina TaxID=299255 RepID=A0A1M5NMP0_9GAMM|nr:sulfurtransferase complex subunit TusB [Ferrimonas marina]SHG90685.1 tRNA 2-thiouridine synthesizing protein B [Ferrimonas marina]